MVDLASNKRLGVGGWTMEQNVITAHMDRNPIKTSLRISAMRIFVGWLLLNLGFFTSESLEAASEVKSVEIVEHGIYQIGPGCDVVGIFPDGSTNQVRPITSAILISATNHVPAVQGVCFGCRFVINGPDKNLLVGLIVVVRHPPFINPADNKLSTVERTPWLYEAGRGSGYMYRLDHVWECVPGEWTIELWHDGSKRAERRFFLERRPEGY